MRGAKLTGAVASLLMFVLASGLAQQSTPPMIVVQPATTMSAPAVTQPVAPDSSGIDAAIKALEQVKSANQETLKKQEAMLQQLDELQKAAEQLKVFAKRA